jgi:hypothetical protein
LGNAFIKTYCCYWDIREQTRFKTSTSLLGHKNILTTSNYLQDSKRSIQDQLRECVNQINNSMFAMKQCRGATSTQTRGTF